MTTGGSGPRAILALAAVLAVAACVEVPAPTTPLASSATATATGTSAGPGGSPSTSPSVVAATPRPTPTPEPTAMRYRIKPGDTLFTIARRFKTPIRRILAANPSISDPNRIEVDQVILIPPKGVDPRGSLLGGLEDAENDPLVRGTSDELIPGHVDISRLEASIEGKNLVVTLSLFGAPPRIGAASEAVTYSIVIDTVDDGEADWMASWSNTLGRGGSYEKSLQDRARGRTVSGSRFPGRVEPLGTSIQWTIPLRALLDPPLIRIGASAESVLLPGRATSERIVDVAPSPLWPAPKAQWLKVGSG